MSEWVLCVDDERDVLTAHRRFLESHFHLETATGGAEALALLAERPFALVISDLQMPGMNGIELLAAARRQYPDTVRLLLTGHADLDSAIHAVNDGHVFRFLTKPCAPVTLLGAARAGVEQYRLITAQKSLLANTLRATVHVLSELLAMANPPAFGRSLRVRQLVCDMTAAAGLPDDWAVDVAAVLSQLGCVAVSEAALTKVERGEELSEAERAALIRHPAVGSELVRSIPRLERVAAIIAHQNYSHAALVRVAANPDVADIVPAAGLLKVALDFDALVQRGEGGAQALATIQAREGWYDPAALTALATLVGRASGRVREIAVEQLAVGMVVAGDVFSASGLLLLKGGVRVTEAIKLRLQSIASHGGLADTITILSADEA